MVPVAHHLYVAAMQALQIETKRWTACAETALAGTKALQAKQKFAVPQIASFSRVEAGEAELPESEAELAVTQDQNPDA